MVVFVKLEWLNFLLFDYEKYRSLKFAFQPIWRWSCNMQTGVDKVSMCFRRWCKGYNLDIGLYGWRKKNSLKEWKKKFYTNRITRRYYTCWLMVFYWRLSIISASSNKSWIYTQTSKSFWRICSKWWDSY